jgi:LPS-assembly protein
MWCRSAQDLSEPKPQALLVDNPRIIVRFARLALGVFLFMPLFALTRSMPRPPGALRPVAAASVGLVVLLAHGTVAAQAPSSSSTGLQLRWSVELQDTLPAEAKDQSPAFVSGQQISGQTDVSTVVEGQAELRKHDIVIKADKLEHLTPTDRAIATGSVRVIQNGNVVTGPRLELQLDTNEGFIETPQFTFIQGGTGDASRVDFEGSKRSTAHNVRYSTCGRTGDAWKPAWMLTASRMTFDQEEDVGTATGAVLSFKGVPLLASPYVTFPLSDKRKSGFLPATLNIDNVSGTELTLPYYLNLAPHYDATLYPTVMSKRGVDLGGEFRYLDRAFNGTYRMAYMPSDKLRDRDRWATSLKHNHRFNGPPALGSIGLRLDLNQVSDDDYWRDFPRTNTNLSERLLPRDAVLTAGQGPWSYSAGVYTWRTLQIAEAPITAPFDRTPSIAAQYRPGSFSIGDTTGWQFSWLGETTHFRTDRDPTLSAVNPDVNGTRLLSVLNLSKTWQAPGWYVRPGVQLHARHYALDQPTGLTEATTRKTHNFIIPTATLDAGLFFDRDTQILGLPMVQTLEPRIFLADTPYKAQSFLPLYDTSALDFNTATIFSAQPFGGHDRLADFKAATIGATSRLINADGQELANLTVAQRVRLKDQRVTLDNNLVTDRLSDILINANVQWRDDWSLNTTVQYNPKTSLYERITVGARYSPGPFRVINAAYREQRNANNPLAQKSSQFDVGWQWPLADLMPGPGPQSATGVRALGPDRWYSVGRVNYDIEDKRVVDMVMGFEYDAGCWIGRIVVERLKQTPTSNNQRILFQLEFSDFSRLGVNPLQTLRENIPRYQYLREQVNPPSRFERYE